MPYYGYFVIFRAVFRSFLRFFAFFVKIFAKKFGGKEKMSTFAIPNETNAEIAQLVEHNLAKVGVASSSLVFRSKKEVSSNADLLFESKVYGLNNTELRLTNIHPTGYHYIVSRPCAQGTAFLFSDFPLSSGNIGST